MAIFVRLLRGGLERTGATRVKNIKQPISYRDQERFSAQGCAEMEPFQHSQAVAYGVEAQTLCFNFIGS